MANVLIKKYGLIQHANKNDDKRVLKEERFNLLNL